MASFIPPTPGWTHTTINTTINTKTRRMGIHSRKATRPTIHHSQIVMNTWMDTVVKSLPDRLFLEYICRDARKTPVQESSDFKAMKLPCILGCVVVPRHKSTSSSSSTVLDADYVMENHENCELVSVLLSKNAQHIYETALFTTSKHMHKYSNNGQVNIVADDLFKRLVALVEHEEHDVMFHDDQDRLLAELSLEHLSTTTAFNELMTVEEIAAESGALWILTSGLILEIPPMLIPVVALLASAEWVKDTWQWVFHEDKQKKSRELKIM